MVFAERFGLLVESGQVSPEAVAAATEVLAGVTAHLGRPLDEETDAMMATHLVMAMERLARGEEIPDLPAVVVEEARGYREEWDLAVGGLARAAARWGRQAPLAEISYLTVHLRSLKGEPT
ncbi:MAG TPA: PRD domain-containing protein [Symbiobacteriaceae bacterium]|jgi:transcriptional regulatory protein LevR